MLQHLQHTMQHGCCCAVQLILALCVCTAGYITRVIMLSRPSLNGLIAQQALLIIPPVLLAIVEYITVSRLIELAAKKNGSNTRSCFAKSVSWCFTGSDIFCLLLQATGGGMYANPDTMNMARALLLAGLGAQIGFFAIFCCIVLYVKRSDRFGYANNQHFKPVFICLYATIALMYIRNIFCVIEFALGYDSYLATHELFLYIFDFAPIYACFLCFTFMHYGFWMGHDAVAQHIKGLPSVKQQDECARPAGLELPKVHIAC